MKQLRNAIALLGTALVFTMGCDNDDADMESGSHSLQQQEIFPETSCESLDALAKYNNGPLPAHCTKIEGGNIGKNGKVVTVDGIQVTITEWFTKDGEKGEFIGFRYTVEGGEIAISVKAGVETFQAEGSGLWKHPGGTSGPSAKGISNVVFCIELTCDDDDGNGGDEGISDGSGSGGQEAGDNSGGNSAGEDPSEENGGSAGEDPSDESGGSAGGDPSDDSEDPPSVV